jgi:glycolate oxidase FAD binding subunit
MLQGEAESALWRNVEEFIPNTVSHSVPVPSRDQRERSSDASTLAAGSASIVVRVAFPLTALAAVLQSAPGPALARAATGVAWLVVPDAAACQTWMRKTSGMGWSRLVECAPRDARRSMDLWPDPGAGLAWMKQLKSTFDPAGILNPGRLYGRL